MIDAESDEMVSADVDGNYGADVDIAICF